MRRRYIHSVGFMPIDEVAQPTTYELRTAVDDYEPIREIRSELFVEMAGFVIHEYRFGQAYAVPANRPEAGFEGSTYNARRAHKYILDISQAERRHSA